MKPKNPNHCDPNRIPEPLARQNDKQEIRCQKCNSRFAPHVLNKAGFCQMCAMKEALRQIKLTALTGTDGPKQLAHIVRLCIDAGITQKLDELKANP